MFTWKKVVSEDSACSSVEGAYWWLSTLVISISVLMTCWLLKSRIRQRGCLLSRILSKHCPLLWNTLVYLAFASLFMSKLCTFLWLSFYCCTTSVLPSTYSFITVVEWYYYQWHHVGKPDWISAFTWFGLLLFEALVLLNAGLWCTCAALFQVISCAIENSRMISIETRDLLLSSRPTSFSPNKNLHQFLVLHQILMDECDCDFAAGVVSLDLVADPVLGQCGQLYHQLILLASILSSFCDLFWSLHLGYSLV